MWHGYEIPLFGAPPAGVEERGVHRHAKRGRPEQSTLRRPEPLWTPTGISFLSSPT